MLTAVYTFGELYNEHHFPVHQFLQKLQEFMAAVYNGPSVQVDTPKARQDLTNPGVLHANWESNRASKE